MKKILSIILAVILALSCAAPAFALSVQSIPSSAVQDQDENSNNVFIAFFKSIFEKIKALFDQIKYFFEVKKEKVPNTMNKNAIHMLKSVQDTIGDSFIITTEDGKVIVIDGGHKFETDYFIQYLKCVTGQRVPKIDAWFLSHPHDDHVQLFNEVAENRTNQVKFDKVLLKYAPYDYYASAEAEEPTELVGAFDRISKAFPEKIQILNDGDIFNIGKAKITVLYTFDPSWLNPNEASLIFRMDLGGRSVLFTGDAGVNAGNKVLANPEYRELLNCDICKMAHHGQDGVTREFYEAVAPEICLWPTPTWVWENTNGNLKTLEVREWMKEIGVKKNIVAWEGSQVLYLFNPKIVTTTDVFEDGYPAETAIDRLARLGYEGIDMGFDYWTFEGSPFMGDDCLGWARSLREHADEVGIPYTHAHSPGEANSGEVVTRSIESAGILGAKYCVVHPVWHDESGNIIKNKTEFISVNAQIIKQLLPKAEECGVIILSENILWGASADPRIIADLVKEVDSPWFGWCFDVGHAHCSGFESDILKKCSVVPASLHIQDNDGSGDGHLIPGDGNINWENFLAVLRDIGYTGDCVMEAHHQSLHAPDEERDAILARLLTESEKLRYGMICENVSE